jgi:uncharacterized membrane protein YkvA (DUF1232 family)
LLRFFHQLRRFLAELAADPRIPARDKAVFVGLCAYLATPLDVIPDFIPVVGYLDDAVVAAVVLDYIFNVVPEPVLLDHFPWTPAKYHSVRRWVRLVSWPIPNFIRRKLWKQVKRTEGPP